MYIILIFCFYIFIFIYFLLLILVKSLTEILYLSWVLLIILNFATMFVFVCCCYFVSICAYLFSPDKGLCCTFSLLEISDVSFLHLMVLFCLMFNQISLWKINAEEKKKWKRERPHRAQWCLARSGFSSSVWTHFLLAV